MFPYREALQGRRFPHLRLDTRHAWPGPEAERVFREQRAQRLWLRAPDADAARATLDGLASTLTTTAESTETVHAGDSGHGVAVAVELDEGADLRAIVADRRVDRVVIASIADAAATLVGRERLPDHVTVEVRLTQALAAWLLARPATLGHWRGRLVARLQNHQFLSESQASDPTPDTLRRLAAAGVRLKNVPRCLARAETEPHDHELLDANLLDRGGDLDLDRYVHHYIEHEYYARSMRCYRCAESATCRGMHVNYLRNHGFRTLRPLDETGAELADAGSFEDMAKVLEEATASRARRDRDRVIGKHQPDASVRVALGTTSLGQRAAPGLIESSPKLEGA
jgi:hypothetical protein